MKGPSPSTRDVALPPHDPPSGFSRSGFAPLPHRHSDHPPLPQPPQTLDERDWDRGRGGGGGGQGSWREDVEHADRWAPRDDWDRRPPPPRWEDDFGALLSYNLPTFMLIARPAQETKITFSIRLFPSSTPSFPLPTTEPVSSPALVPVHRPCRTAQLLNISSVCRLVQGESSANSASRRGGVEEVQARCGEWVDLGQGEDRYGQAVRAVSQGIPLQTGEPGSHGQSP